MDAPLRRISFRKMRVSGAVKAAGGRSQRSSETALSTRREGSAKSVVPQRTCRLTIGFPTRLPVRPMETTRRNSWFCAGHAIVKSHGAASTAKTGSASTEYQSASPAIGRGRPNTCISQPSNNEGLMLSGGKMKSTIMKGFGKKPSERLRRFPNTSSDCCEAVRRKMKPAA